MSKEFNDVYGKVDLDYANEFNEFNAEREIECAKINMNKKECDSELTSSGCEGS